MARIPGVRWRPIPENADQPRIRPTQWIVHTFVDSPSADLERMADYFERRDIVLESHTILGWADHVQLMDTEVRADANRYANRRPDGTGAISTETEDDGRPVENPWNAYQVRELIRTGIELHRLHGIPARLCRNPDDPGMGWHAMFGAPSAWTPAVGKTCPGSTRIKQFKEVILPAIQKAVAPQPPPPPPPPVPEPDLGSTAMSLIYVPELKRYFVIVPWGVRELTLAEGYALDQSQDSIDAVRVPLKVWQKITVGAPTA